MQPRISFWLILFWLSTSLGIAHAENLGLPASIGDPDPERIQYWEALLPDVPRGVGPTIDQREIWEEIAQREEFSDVVDRARILAATPIPELDDELYLDYSRTGNRGPAEKRIHERGNNFSTLVFAECIENRGNFLPAIERAIVSYDRQKTWLYPAHDPHLDNFRGETVEVSICSSALGWNIATAAYWLGDRLKPETRRMVADNLERRFFTPVENLVRTGKPRTRWLLMTNNHNSVTLAGVTGTAFAQIESRSRRAYFAAVAEKFIENYFVGFTSDGYCSEGVGYWNYGFGRFLMLAETLRQASGGKVDWLEQERVRKIAEFGRRIEIGDGLYPSFSDCDVEAHPSRLLLGILSRRYDWGLHNAEAQSAALGRRTRGPLFAFGLYGQMTPSQKPQHQPTPPLAKRDYFPEGEVLICRPGDHRRSLAVAMKGGHNQEHHNHNDVGSFIVNYGKSNLLVDPGAEIYTSRTFSGRRYESNVLSSFGHSVPKVAGKLQSTGRHASAEILESSFSDARDTLVLDLAKAYDLKSLKELRRTFVYDRTHNGAFTVADQFSSDEPLSFETALITFSPWNQEAQNRLRIGEGTESLIVEIATEGSNFRVVATEIHEDLPKQSVPVRIAIELIDPVTAGKVTTTIRSAKQTDVPGK